MKAFLNRLSDSIIILDEAKEIIFVNEALLKKVTRGTVIGSEAIKDKIKIDHKEITVQLGNGKIYRGRYDSHPGEWAGENCHQLVIQWQDEEAGKEGLLEKLLDRMKDYIFVRDINDQYVYANQHCADAYNVSKEEVLEIMTDEVELKANKALISEKNEYVKTTKNNCVYEVIEEHKGVKGFYEVKKCPILNDEGEVAYIGTYVKDITVIENIEEQILENLILFTKEGNEKRVTLKKTPQDIWNVLKQVFEHYYGTKRFNLFIYNPSQETLEPYFNKEKYKASDKGKKGVSIEKQDIQKLIKEGFGEVKYIDGRGFLKSKEATNCYVAQYPLMYKNEFKGILILAYSQDPGEQPIGKHLMYKICREIGLIIKYIELSRLLEEELESRNKLEQELELFLELSSDFLVKTDSKGRYQDASKNATKILGWSKEEILNMDWKQMIHPDEREQIIQHYYEMTKEGKECIKLTGVNRYRCKDGTYKWIRWQGGLSDSKGNMLATCQDITYEKELEEREQAVEKLIHLEEVRNEFFANLSHEFKTPITIILSALQMINMYIEEEALEEQTYKKFKKHLGSIKQNSNRLLRMVTNLIDVTKMDAGFYNIYPRNCNIVSVVEDITLSVANYSLSKGIELIFDTEIEEGIIACDPDQVERIMLNLLGNAIKYNSDEGKIDVMVELEEDHVLISITDTGIGIPKEKAEFIFERFMQVQSILTRQREGSGIGLALVKSLVEMHEGSIELESEEGVGSTFKVRLPRKVTTEESVPKETRKEEPFSKLEKCIIEFSDIYNE